MTGLKLSFISGPHERVMPLIDGRVRVEGVDDITTTISDPSVTFWRQLTFWEFELSEMSLSSYLIARSKGADMIAVPVFPTRRFMHMGLSINTASGADAPQDLVGKRIGVGDYQQTSALWTRGILEHDFNVSQYKVEWWMERPQELSHGGATGFAPPADIDFHYIPRDKSLASMLVNRELDAAPVSRAFGRASNIVDRSTHIRAAEADWSKVRPLFTDPIAEGKRFFDEWGFIPANHTVTIRGDVYRKYPWLAFNLYEALLKAKQIADEELPERISQSLIFGPQYLAQTRRMFGRDPFPYGVEPNRKFLQTTIDFSHEQGLTPVKEKIEDLFAPSTLTVQ
jgi:4,5-dihydroxyphthalate decarboxylase